MPDSMHVSTTLSRSCMATLAGHVHAYERTVRVFDNQPNECGPVHIVIGDGGNREVRSFIVMTNCACCCKEGTICVSKEGLLQGRFMVPGSSSIETNSAASHACFAVGKSMLKTVTTSGRLRERASLMPQGLANSFLKSPEWSAMREASYGHATLDFEGATSAVFRWHRNQARPQALLPSALPTAAVRSSPGIAKLSALLPSSP